jgi:Acetyltransferase (GNAT) domain
VLRQADAKDIDSIALLDRSASGLERRFLLESFLSRPATRAWLFADDRGFVIAREGRRATQIGPLVARDAQDAIRLLDCASRAGKAQAFVDVPTSRHEIATWLERQGFVRQRSFVRMSRGVAQGPPAIGERCFALAGPEFG